MILKGNLPGEPPLELGPVGSHIVVAGGCHACPFQSDGDGRPFCNADPGYRMTEPNYGETWPNGRPSWCPLDTGPVTVEIRKP